MSDWKKQLENFKQKNVVVRNIQPNVTATSIEAKKQELQDRELLLKKQQAKLRRKLKIEDSKEPYHQSVGLMQNLQSELRKNDISLRLIKREIDGLIPDKNEQLVRPVVEVSALDKIKWLNQNRVVDKEINLESTKPVKSSHKRVDLSSDCRPNIELLKEAKRLIKLYAIVKCDDCRDGQMVLLCPKCGGLKRVALHPTIQVIRVKCNDDSFSCSLCGGVGFYYEKQQILTEDCDCRTGVIGIRKCVTCFGTGVVATRSSKNNPPVLDLMKLLSSKKNIHLLQAIKSAIGK